MIEHHDLKNEDGIVVCPNEHLHRSYRPYESEIYMWFGFMNITCPLCIKVSDWRKQNEVHNSKDNSHVFSLELRMEYWPIKTDGSVVKRRQPHYFLKYSR